jgi:hypothetical protein
MIAIFWIYKHEERLEKDDFDSLLERVENAGSGVDIKLGQCLKRLYFIDQSVASRILKSRELEDDETLVLARQQIVCRARWIWSKIFAV